MGLLARIESGFSLSFCRGLHNMCQISFKLRGKRACLCVYVWVCGEKKSDVIDSSLAFYLYFELVERNAHGGSVCAQRLYSSGFK